MHPLPDGEREGSTSEVACLAVFDGHGGDKASHFVRDNLFKVLLNHQDFRRLTFKAVEDAYQETDDLYLEQDELQKNDDGCTATTAVIVGRRLVVAHVGDSRAVLGEGGTATPLTDDHKPNRPDERNRIENVGGTVVHAGTWRVGGVLAVSRSFGNRQLKQWIVAHPEIREDKLHSSTSCLVLATDGVWDVVTNQEAVEAVGRFEDAEQAARYLAAMAYERGSYDNISCVVCLFDFKEEDDTEPAQEHVRVPGSPLRRKSAAPEKAAVATADTTIPKQSARRSVDNLGASDGVGGNGNGNGGVNGTDDGKRQVTFAVEEGGGVSKEEAVTTAIS